MLKQLKQKSHWRYGLRTVGDVSYNQSSVSFSLSPAADVLVQMQSCGADDSENMNMEATQDLSSGETETFVLIK